MSTLALPPYCRTVCVLLGTILLSSCADKGLHDLEQFVDEIKKRETVLTDKVPEFPPEEIHIYPAKGRSPFEKFATQTDLAKIDQDVTKDSKPCLRPDLHRVKEQLEAFPLDSLHMVGTLTTKERGTVGLVEDTEGLIYQVEVGNYIGQNYGKIIAILDSRIELIEQINDGTGCFLETEAALQVKGAEG